MDKKKEFVTQGNNKKNTSHLVRYHITADVILGKSICHLSCRYLKKNPF